MAVFFTLHLRSLRGSDLELSRGASLFKTQLFCNGKVCDGIRIERLVGQASLNSAVDHQFDLIALDDTARI